MNTKDKQRLNVATNGNGSTPKTPPSDDHDHIEAIAEKASQDFIETAAAVTRAKITEKLQNGTFTSLVFAEHEEIFTRALSCGSTVNVLSGSAEA